MKRAIPFLLCAVLMLFCFTACGEDLSDSPYVGTWTSTTAEYSGFEMSVDSLFDGDLVFELKDNGRCVGSIGSEDASGKWTETENGFNVEDEFDFVVDGDTATMEYSGVTISFTKTS